MALDPLSQAYNDWLKAGQKGIDPFTAAVKAGSPTTLPAGYNPATGAVSGAPQVSAIAGGQIRPTATSAGNSLNLPPEQYHTLQDMFLRQNPSLVGRPDAQQAMDDYISRAAGQGFGAVAGSPVAASGISLPPKPVGQWVPNPAPGDDQGGDAWLNTVTHQVAASPPAYQQYAGGPDKALVDALSKNVYGVGYTQQSFMTDPATGELQIDPSKKTLTNNPAIIDLATMIQSQMGPGYVPDAATLKKIDEVTTKEISQEHDRHGLMAASMPANLFRLIGTNVPQLNAPYQSFLADPQGAKIIAAGNEEQGKQMPSGSASGLHEFLKAVGIGVGLPALGAFAIGGLAAFGAGAEAAGLGAGAAEAGVGLGTAGAIDVAPALAGGLVAPGTGAVVGEGLASVAPELAAGAGAVGAGASTGVAGTAGELTAPGIIGTDAGTAAGVGAGTAGAGTVGSTLAGSGITDEALLTGQAAGAGGTATGDVAGGFTGAGAGAFGTGVPAAVGGTTLSDIGKVLSGTGTVANAVTGTGGVGGALAGIGAGINKITQPGATAAASAQQVDALRQAIGATQQYGTAAQAQLAPYAAAGASGISGLQGLASTSANPNQYLDPSMAFTMAQGQQALERSAAARGGVMSGAALKDISQYITGLANQNFNSATQLSLANRQQQIGANTALTQTGLNAADVGAGLNVATGGQIASGIQNLGAAQAQGTAAAGQAPGSIISGVGGLLSGVGGLAQGADALGNLFSDERVKSNVRPGDDVVKQTLDGLTAHLYEYQPYATERGAPTGTQVGVTAQAIERSPAKNLVERNTDGVRTVNIPRSVGFLLASSAHLNQRINQLERK